MTEIHVGVDAGGTLIKIAYMKDHVLSYTHFPTKSLGEAANWLNSNFPEAKICVTGGKGNVMKEKLLQKTTSIIEFEATCLGVKYLLKNKGTSQFSFLLTNVGTGTSIHYVTPDLHYRIGGSGVGGGTLLGLSYLLSGITEYDQIIEQAKLGQRAKIDLTVGQIYEGVEEPPISADLTASNFGNIMNIVEKEETSDMLAAVVGLVGETVSSLSVHAAAQCGTSAIMYIGSSFKNNSLLKEVVEQYTYFKGANPFFLEKGEYSGAIGALLSLK